jgi:ribokinase
VLVVNETELAAVSGTRITETSDDDEIEAAARMFLRDARSVIATLGARGAIAIGPDGVRKAPGRAVPVVDTTGAGDCFVGAFAATLATGADRDIALQRANDAAALSVQRPGAAPSMPTMSDLKNSFS